MNRHDGRHRFALACILAGLGVVAVGLLLAIFDDAIAEGLAALHASPRVAALVAYRAGLLLAVVGGALMLIGVIELPRRGAPQSKSKISDRNDFRRRR